MLEDCQWGRYPGKYYVGIIFLLAASATKIGFDADAADWGFRIDAGHVEFNYKDRRGE